MKESSIIEDLVNLIETTKQKPIEEDVLEVKPDFAEGYQLDNMRTFNLLFFTDSLKRFVESLDYFVLAYDFIFKVVTYEKPLLTL